MKICVVALGKIGLPLAVQFASKGHEVVGADVSQHVVDLVNDGMVPFPGEADLDVKLKEAVAAGLLTATTDTAAAVAQSEAVVVVVPLFVDADGTPDFDWMDNATQSIAPRAQAGHAGQLRDDAAGGHDPRPLGADARAGLRSHRRPGLLPGLQPGAGPHRPGLRRPAPLSEARRRHRRGLGRVAASSSTQSVLDFDDRADLPRPNGVWDLGSAEASEMAKLAETTYRDVNIGLANQFARFADTVGIDVTKVIEACNTQPYSHIHQPGIAVGGHCIPIYPRMYLWNDPAATVVRSAREANADMPEYAVSLLESAYGDLSGVGVLVLGASYRGAVKETAFSGVFPTVAALRARGADAVRVRPDVQLGGAVGARAPAARR